MVGRWGRKKNLKIKVRHDGIRKSYVRYNTAENGRVYGTDESS